MTSLLLLLLLTQTKYQIKEQSCNVDFAEGQFQSLNFEDKRSRDLPIAYEQSCANAFTA